MAEIVLGIGSSHGPQTHLSWEQWPLLAEKDVHDPRIDYEALLERAKPDIEHEITPERMRLRFEAGQESIGTLRTLVAKARPDVILVVGDDQHEQFGAQNMPMFSIFHGSTMPAKTRGRNRDPERAWNHAPWREALTIERPPDNAFDGDPELALHLIGSLVHDGIDVAVSNALRPDIGLGHAFMIFYDRLCAETRVPMVPFMVNTFFPPNQPTPARCYAVGKAIRQAIDTWDSDKRVAVMASGGLSHVVLDEEIDAMVIDAITRHDAPALCALPIDRLNLGTSEIRNWVTVAGILEDRDFHLINYITSYRSKAGTGIGHAFASWS